MPSSLSKQDYMTFSNGLASYVYINEDGRLDLEDFCVTLVACLLHDATGLKRARPESFHSLLIEVLRNFAKPEELSLWIQSQKLLDWTPQMAYLYPDGKRTFIHVSALLCYGHDWIASIGSDILDIAEDEWSASYFGWAREEWYFTYEFLSGYHNSLNEFVKRFDAKLAIEKDQPSHFEILHHSMASETNFDVAKQTLQMRDDAWKNALERVSKSMDAGYHLEAISLAENLITHLLFNWVSSRKKISPDSSLNTLIQIVKSKQTKPENVVLLDEVDAWRKDRNNAIHRFVTSSIDDLTNNRDTLSSSSAETSKRGREIVSKMLMWYREEAVDFVEHRFPRMQRDA